MHNPKEILIVEDEAFTAMSLRLQLEKAGYKVCDIISTGEQAIITALRVNPDIILMDIRLAGRINGLEAAEQIIKEISSFIIFMTGYDDKELQQRANNIHTSKYMIKPIMISELIRAINTTEMAN